MSTKQTLWAVIPAAGRGQRMQSSTPKQYQLINGKSMLQRSVEALQGLGSSFNLQIIVALANGDKYWRQQACATDPAVSVTEGGASRAESVLAGLRAIKAKAAEQDLVFVHDAARPCVGESDLRALLKTANEHDAGALLAVPVIDTLKRVNSNLTIERTENRAQFYQAQTPQAFRYELICKALELALESLSQGNGLNITDEASAVEALGLRPKIVVGQRSNVKITYPEDLKYAEAYFSNL